MSLEQLEQAQYEDQEFDLIESQYGLYEDEVELDFE